MIVNQTVFTKKDLEFSMKHSRRKKFAFSVYFVGFCGVFLLILGVLTICRGGRMGTVALAFAAGTLFILWCVFFNKISVWRALKLPSLKAPRTYEFSDGEARCRIALNGIESSERYSYSIMEKYFEENNAVYIMLTIDGRKRFFALHNDSYSEGSPEELKALLESRGVHKGGQ
ncbi:MAG: hypothetical protein HDT43_11670 [Ruminococcaceae bacterium]|nr:hypothetical protein [Oscillospiraceae bacterium]